MQCIPPLDNNIAQSSHNWTMTDISDSRRHESTNNCPDKYHTQQAQNGDTLSRTPHVLILFVTTKTQFRSTPLEDPREFQKIPLRTTRGRAWTPFPLGRHIRETPSRLELRTPRPVQPEFSWCRDEDVVCSHLAVSVGSPSFKNCKPMPGIDIAQLQKSRTT